MSGSSSNTPTTVGSASDPYRQLERHGASAQDAPIVIIEGRSLFRDCVAHCFRSVSELKVEPVASVAEWLELSRTVSASLVVLSKAGPRNDDEIARDLTELAQAASAAPIIIVSDVEDTDSIVHALEKGASGYVPTTLSLDVALGAMRLVRAGGTFVPAASLIAAHRVAETAERERRPSTSMFTSRQIAVVEALRRGKANKMIAYELNMCESTVKVHVRNIMKKLKAKNRTQVAFMASELLRSERV